MNKIIYISLGLMCCATIWVAQASDQEKAEEIFRKKDITDADIEFLKKADFDPNKNVKYVPFIKLAIDNARALELLDILKEKNVLLEDVFLFIGNNSKPEFVKKLLEMGADPLKPTPNFYGRNALHLLAGSAKNLGSFEVLLNYLNSKGILQHGLSIRDEIGNTPLMALMYTKRDSLSEFQAVDKMLDLLIAYKVDPTPINEERSDAVAILQNRLMHDEASGTITQNVKDEVLRIIDKLKKYKARFIAQEAAKSPEVRVATQEELKENAPLMPPQPAVRGIIADYVGAGELDLEQEKSPAAQEGDEPGWVSAARCVIQ